jgi:hypothetical protein
MKRFYLSGLIFLFVFSLCQVTWSEKAIGDSDMTRKGSKIGSENRLTIAAVGDLMIGTENLLPPDNGEEFFSDSKPYFQDRDIVFGNLEGPLTDRGAPTKDTSTGRSYCFRTPPSYGRLFKEAGFNIMSLANNHAFDYGSLGHDQTIETLENLGIAYTGAPGQITFMEIKGKSVTFIGLAPNKGCQNINDIDGAVAMVKKALKEKPNTLVFVSMHGGAEGSKAMALPIGVETFLGENRGNLVKLSHALIDAGAVMVIGHGPHVPRAMEVYNGHLIAYSLGNFATAAGINVSGPSGLAPLLLAEIDEKGNLLEYEIISFRQKMNAGPKLDKTNEADEVIKKLSTDLEKALAGKN